MWIGQGATNRSLVTVQLIRTNEFPAPDNAPLLFDNELAAAGSATLQNVPVGIGFTLPGLTNPDPNGVEIIVTQQPAVAPSLVFTAPGLTLGGEQTWKYVWDFRGLVAQ